MNAGIKITGSDAFMSLLADMQRPESARSVGVAFAYSSLGVIERACKNAMPGSTKQEVGKYVRVTGNRVWGRAGLIKFPRPGDGQNGPHGVYLDQGTQFIPARRYIAVAVNGALSAAMLAGRMAAKRQIRRIASVK